MAKSVSLTFLQSMAHNDIDMMDANHCLVDSILVLDLMYLIVFHVHVDVADIENKKNHLDLFDLRRRRRRTSMML